MRRKLVLLVAGIAAQRFGTKLEAEQEILVNIADIANNLFMQWNQLFFVQKKQLSEMV